MLAICSQSGRVKGMVSIAFLLLALSACASAPRGPKISDVEPDCEAVAESQNLRRNMVSWEARSDSMFLSLTDWSQSFLNTDWESSRKQFSEGGEFFAPYALLAESRGSRRDGATNERAEGKLSTSAQFYEFRDGQVCGRDKEYYPFASLRLVSPSGEVVQDLKHSSVAVLRRLLSLEYKIVGVEPASFNGVHVLLKPEPDSSSLGHYLQYTIPSCRPVWSVMKHDPIRLLPPNVRQEDQSWIQRTLYFSYGDELHRAIKPARFGGYLVETANQGMEDVKFLWWSKMGQGVEVSEAIQAPEFSK